MSLHFNPKPFGQFSKLNREVLKKQEEKVETKENETKNKQEVTTEKDVDVVEANNKLLENMNIVGLQNRFVINVTKNKDNFIETESCESQANFISDEIFRDVMEKFETLQRMRDEAGIELIQGKQPKEIGPASTFENIDNEFLEEATEKIETLQRMREEAGIELIQGKQPKMVRRY